MLNFSQQIHKTSLWTSVGSYIVTSCTNEAILQILSRVYKLKNVYQWTTDTQEFTVESENIFKTF